MMLLRIEQQKIRILKMSRDFTDLPTDKLADLKNKENFDRTSLRSLSQKSKKTKEKSAVKICEVFDIFIKFAYKIKSAPFYRTFLTNFHF